MRKALLAPAACLVALLVLGIGGTALAALLEPVTVTASAPETVAAGKAFKLEVAVEAEPGALDIAAMPLTLGVKLAPECGGSLAGTPGAPVLLKTLPNPAPGAAYAQMVSGQVNAPGSGTDVICAFLQDSQERQFATDTEAEVSVGGGAGSVKSCTAASKRLKKAKRGLKRLEHRIHKVQRKLHHTKGQHRKALAHKLHELRAHKRKALKRRKAAAKQVKACR